MFVLDLEDVEQGGPVPSDRWTCPRCGSASWTAPTPGEKIRAPVCRDCEDPTAMARDSRYRAEDRGDDEAIAEFDRVTELRDSISPEERRSRTLSALHRETVHGPDWKAHKRIPKAETAQRVARAWRWHYRNRSGR